MKNKQELMKRTELISTEKERQGVIKWVLEELSTAEGKFPKWPIDVVHAASIVAEEQGEMQQAALEYLWFLDKDNDLLDNLLIEATHTAAMAVRFLIQLWRLGDIEIEEEEA